jgi:hypothetical protein
MLSGEEVRKKRSMTHLLNEKPRRNCIRNVKQVCRKDTLDQRATAQLPLREHDVGYGIMLRVAREAILLHEQLGFDCWPRLVAQVRTRDGARAEDDVLETCRLEAIMDDILVVSVPTAQDKTQLTEHYLDMLEELASPPPQRRQIRVLVR